MSLRNIITATMVCACAGLQAQTDSLLFRSSHSMNDEEKGNITIRTDMLSFFKDNEYQGERAVGYTLPGFRIQPALCYQPLGNVKIEAGLNLLRYWGADSYPLQWYRDIPQGENSSRQKMFHVMPVFRVHLTPAEDLHIVLGTLYGGSNHNLAAPLYNDEYGLTADPENGLQIMLDKTHFDMDAWISWENFIFRGDKQQEAFTLGLSTSVKANSRQSAVHAYFPIQILFRHQGGEINDPDGPRVQTWLNAAAGAGLMFRTSSSLVPYAGVECLAATYSQMAGHNLPLDKGYGIYATARAKIWVFDVKAGYWYNDNFVSLYGDPHYSAIGTTEDHVIFGKSHMLTANLGYSYTFGKGYTLGASADLLYMPQCTALKNDAAFTEKKAVSFCAGVYFRANPEFLIKNIKKKNK